MPNPLFQRRFNSAGEAKLSEYSLQLVIQIHVAIGGAVRIERQQRKSYRRIKRAESFVVRNFMSMSPLAPLSASCFVGGPKVFQGACRRPRMA